MKKSLPITSLFRKCIQQVHLHNTDDGG